LFLLFVLSLFQAATYFPYHTVDGRVALPILLSVELFRNPVNPVIPEGVNHVTFYVMGAHNETENAPGNYWFDNLT
jgi:hypothetical protein